MISASTNNLIDELLGRRREYHSHFERRAPQRDRSFSDVDYVVTWYLVARLGTTSLDVDDTEVLELFQAARPAPGIANLQLTLATASDPPAPAHSAFGRLCLFSAQNNPADKWLAGVAAEGSLALCYGLRGPLDPSLAHALQVVSQGTAEAVFVPLFAAVPSLWRAASLLIANRNRLATLSGVVKQLTDTFAGDDLDALQLAEENLSLRATIGRLSTPSSSQGELDHLKETIATLEAQIAALRRTAVAQEESIAVMLLSQDQRRQHTGNSGHPRVAGR